MTTPLEWAWLRKFPGHPAMTALTVALTLATGIIVLIHMALGHHMPDGYGDWYVFLGGLTGVNVAGMGVQRVTDYQYQQIKNQATPPVQAGGPTTVEVKPDV